MRNSTLQFLMLASVLACTQASAQQTAPQPFKQPAYGASITFEQAKTAAAAAVREAESQHWPSSIAVVGTSGELMFFEHMDNTSFASIDLSIHKARTAARFRSPTGRFAERIAAGLKNAYLLSFDGMIAGPGGNLIVVGNKVIGAIGVSGSTGPHDEQVSLAGASVLK
jgi:glc operon protein GlcG